MDRPIEVKIRRIDAGSKDLPLPVRMTQYAAGFDLHAGVSQATTISPGQILLVPCGFAMALPEGYEAQIRPRSGMASKFGVAPVNSPGTIDADYRGEVKVALINHGQAPFTIERGARIAQMVIMPVPKVNIIEVTELDETARGQGGFGHTDRNFDL